MIARILLILLENFVNISHKGKKLHVLYASLSTLAQYSYMHYIETLQSHLKPE